MSKYEHTCFGCQYADISPRSHENMNGSQRTIRCSEYHQYVEPFSEGYRCHGYRNGGYSDRYLDELVETFNKWCNYYIISACTRIVDMPNAESYLQAFKEFKEDEIKKDSVVSLLQRFAITPEELLRDYDTYGKAVADAMENAHNNPETKTACEEHIKTKILPVLDELLELKSQGKSKRAIVGYIALTRSLMDFYHIEYKESAKESNISLEEAPMQRQKI